MLKISLKRHNNGTSNQSRKKRKSTEKQNNQVDENEADKSRNQDDSVLNNVLIKKRKPQLSQQSSPKVSSPLINQPSPIESRSITPISSAASAASSASGQPKKLKLRLQLPKTDRHGDHSDHSENLSTNNHSSKESTAPLLIKNTRNEMNPAAISNLLQNTDSVVSTSPISNPFIAATPERHTSAATAISPGTEYASSESTAILLPSKDNLTVQENDQTHTPATTPAPESRHTKHTARSSKSSSIPINSPEQDKSIEEDGWTAPDSNPQKNKKFFRIGPNFKRTHQNFPIFDTQGNEVFAILACRIDRGFHHVEDEWITYRRNYITLSTAFSLTKGDVIEYGKIPRCNLFVNTGDGKRARINYFSLRITALEIDRSGTFDEVGLIQHTPKRNKGVKRAPPLIPAVPGLLPSHDFIKNNTTFRTSTRKKAVEGYITYPKNQLGEFGKYYPYDQESGGNIPYVGLFERIQFTTPNGGDSRLVKTLVQLVATIETGESYVAAWCETPYFTLRIRSPSSYGDNVSLVRRKSSGSYSTASQPRAIVQVIPGQPKLVSKFSMENEGGNSSPSQAMYGVLAPGPSHTPGQLTFHMKIPFSPIYQRPDDGSEQAQAQTGNAENQNAESSVDPVQKKSKFPLLIPKPTPQSLLHIRPFPNHIVAPSILQNLNAMAAKSKGKSLSSLSSMRKKNKPIAPAPSNTQPNIIRLHSKANKKDQGNTKTRDKGKGIHPQKPQAKPSSHTARDEIAIEDDDEEEDSVVLFGGQSTNIQSKLPTIENITSPTAVNVTRSPGTPISDYSKPSPATSSTPLPEPASRTRNSPLTVDSSSAPNARNYNQASGNQDSLKFVEVSYSEPRKPVPLNPDSTGTGSLRMLPSSSIFTPVNFSSATQKTGDKVLKVGRRQVRRNWSDHQTVFKISAATPPSKNTNSIAFIKANKPSTLASLASAAVTASSSTRASGAPLMMSGAPISPKPPQPILPQPSPPPQSSFQYGFSVPVPKQRSNPPPPSSLYKFSTFSSNPSTPKVNRKGKK